MYNAMQQLSKLPSETLVYCGHEYTLSNLKFALTIEPDNPHLQKKVCLGPIYSFSFPSFCFTIHMLVLCISVFPVCVTVFFASIYIYHMLDAAND